MRTGYWIAAGVGAAVAVLLAVAVLFWLEGSGVGSEEKLSTVVQNAPSPKTTATNPPPQKTTSANTPHPTSAPSVLSDDNPSRFWFVIAMLVMALAILLSTFISFYLYRWRKILLSNPHFVVPEQQGKWMMELDKHIANLTRAISSHIDTVGRQGKETHQDVANLSETFMVMQQALDDREKEIQRLKRGYDSEIFRKFVKRFIRVDEAVEDFQRSGSADANDLHQIRLLLGDAFSECNVECFQPELGNDYREAFGVADHPKKQNAESPEDDFKIVEILESGYLIRNAESRDVIKPAKVRIFSFQQEADS